ncbi:MAG: hypothetical protein FWE32_00030 [Oscillospiraceae bacterium]|nr:hypothetical protein [Oscillospiraceae bacterium]
MRIRDATGVIEHLIYVSSLEIYISTLGFSRNKVVNISPFWLNINAVITDFLIAHSILKGNKARRCAATDGENIKLRIFVQIKSFKRIYNLGATLPNDMAGVIPQYIFAVIFSPAIGAVILDFFQTVGTTSATLPGWMIAFFAAIITPFEITITLGGQLLQQCGIIADLTALYHIPGMLYNPLVISGALNIPNFSHIHKYISLLR